MSRPASVATASAAEGLSGMPWAARLYVIVMIVAGLGCLYLALPRIDISSPGWLAALLVIGLATATIHLPLPLAQGRSSMSVSHAVVVMAMLTSGPAAAVLLVVATTLVQSTVRTRLVSRPHRTLFNIGSLVVTVTLARRPRKLARHGRRPSGVRRARVLPGEHAARRNRGCPVDQAAAAACVAVRFHVDQPRLFSRRHCRGNGVLFVPAERLLVGGDRGAALSDHR